MRLLEHQSKTLLSRYGLTFSACRVCHSPAEAVAAAALLGGDNFVLKAQVPFGGRGKAGAIQFVEGVAGVCDAADQLLKMTLRGRAVSAISVETEVSVAREFYVGIAWDSAHKRPVAILSTAGGVDVEVSEEGRVARRTIDPFVGLQAFEGREMACELGVDGRVMTGLGDVLARLSCASLELDGVVVELNPLAETTDGKLIGLDAHVELDDDAAYRVKHKLEGIGAIEGSATGRPQTELEREAQQIDAMDHRGVAGRVVEFDGDLALLIGGGGASLTVFDAIRRHGGKPANYCEVGGNPTEEKVAALVTLLLEKPGVQKMAVIMNVVNNTRADVMARGAIAGVRRAGRSPEETIIVFRIPGSWEPEARAILAETGIEALGRETSLDEAARLAVVRSAPSLCAASAETH